MIRPIKYSYALIFPVVLIAVAVLFPFKSGAAPGSQQQTQSQSASVRELPNYDALSASPKSAAAVPTQGSGQDQTPPQTEGGHLVQYEPRLAVPTFLWASEAKQGRALSLAAVATQVGPKGGGLESIARDHLSNYASTYRLAADDIKNAVLTSISDTGKGPIIVKFKQEIAGVEVFRDEVAIIMNRDLQLVAISGYLTGGNDDSVAAFSLQSTDAITKALTDLTGSTINPSALTTASRLNETGTTGNQDYQYFTAAKAQTPGFALGDVVRSKAVMYHLVDQYVPSYYIEINVQIPVIDSSQVDLAGNPATNWVTEAYSYVISAVDGQILFRKNLSQNDAYTYRVWADPATKIPYDSPAGNGVDPKITAGPDGVQYAFIPTQDITLQNFAFNRNDPWLAPGATETVGNNVDAYADLVNPDGRNPVAAPADPATGDFRAQISAAGQFLHTHTPDGEPKLAEPRQATIQQLFYDVNFLHDWYYEAGFDELSGNAQATNYGRGGSENDALHAEAQDVSGRNNANMLTPADGASPRMQMFVFDSNAVRYVDVLSPAAAAGQRAAGYGQFGTQIFDVTNDVVQPNPVTGCTLGSYAGAAGKFVMVDREPTATCSIGTKVTNAMDAGAAGFILVNLSTTPTIPINVTGSLPTFTIPFLSISWNGAATIKTQLAAAQTVTARMRRDLDIDRDGGIDNQIVFHEWGHYLSNRLIANSAGLVTTQATGLGEGWGDFNAMLLTVREDDAAVASNATFNGTYALGTYAASGGVNEGYYYGTRRYPYSTDLNKNPLTLGHIQQSATLPVGPSRNPSTTISTNNSEVHNTGEIWATMLWECYASLLRDTQGPSPRLSFTEAQQRMKYYLVASLKLTPGTPTFLDARDAVLAAAYATDPIDYQRFLTAFAKRGAGFGAVIPDRFTVDNNGLTESFTLGTDATFTGATLDDSLSLCDQDGVLDTGETGHLVMTLRNIGQNTLTATTGTLTSTTPGVTIANGGNVTFGSINPNNSTSVSVNVSLATGIAGVQSLDFQLTYNDPQFVSQHTASFSLRGNTNTIPQSSSTDTEEPLTSPWTALSLPPTVVSGGNTIVVGVASPFRRKEVSALQHNWHVDDVGSYTEERLTSPFFTVDGSGSFNLQFDHEWHFEFDGGGNYDGGVLEISVNGGMFTDFTFPGYNGVILNQGAGSPNPLRGKNGFVNNGGPTHASFTQAIAPGSTIQVRFREGSDGSVGSSGWDIDNISFSGVVETPFGTLVADSGSCPVPNPTPVTLQLTPNVLPAGTINAAYPTTVLTASGGGGSYNYSLVPFGLPPGLVHDIVGGGVQISGTGTQAGTYPLTVVVNDNAGHHATFNYSITINKLVPNVTWNNPADITYPAALSATQLNATADVPGSLTYTPVSGTVPNAGAGQTLSVTFVPTDTALYSNVTKTVTINVVKVTPTITWSNPADITYGTSLGGTQLNATADVAGVLTYTPPSGTVLNAGNAQTLSVNFVPTDNVNYNNQSKNVSINVLKATPSITWNNPVDITYPATLGGVQLNATANVPGVFTYTPTAGTVLNAGSAQTLAVDFVPTDGVNYKNTSNNVSINVLKATSSVTWNNPADITYPATLNGLQLNATADVAGALTYTPPSGTVLNSGTQTLAVNFVPTDTVNYNNASKSVSINVLKGTPTITWNNPADIAYPAALSGAQLNATANAPGVFTYTPPSGTVLSSGNGQTLAVNFVPTDAVNYKSTSNSVSINVLKGTPTISWNNPGDIFYPAALTGAQLNATASLPGTLTYTPPAGTVLNSGGTQALSVNFVPTDAANYNNASTNVSINVLQGTPTITWNTPVDITYPAALSGTQLNATANATGAFTYTPPAGTVLNSGSAQTLAVNFVPTDAVNYKSTSSSVSIDVLMGTPSITWNNPADIAYGTALGATQLNATVSVAGTLSYAPAATTILNTGNGQALSVTFAPADTANYNSSSKNVQINVTKANQTITFGPLSAKTFGDSDFNISATASSNLTVTLAAAGNCTVNSGSVHLSGAGSCTITASQAGDSNYNAATNVPGTFSVGKAATATVVTSSANPSELGNAVTFSATVTATAAGTPTGTIQFKDNGTNIGGAQSQTAGQTTFATSALTIGTHAITAEYSGDINFNASTGTLLNGQLVNSQPSISINDISLSEGDSGSKSATFTVTLSNTSSSPVTVNYATADGTANTPADYLATSGTLTFAPGDSARTISVTINGDQSFEPDESFFVNLSGATNATVTDGQGIGAILNDDGQVSFNFSATNYSVAEDGRGLTITVNRGGSPAAAVTVDYATTDDSDPSRGVSCATANGTASSRCDFTTVAGTLEFAAGESSKTFNVLVSTDSYVEGPETFHLTLSRPSDAGILGATATTLVTITDAVTQPATNPVDGADNFVRQQYHDFLNREGDSGGQAFWTSKIADCGSDALCIQRQRIGVSAEFFIQQEFQQTAFYVYRAYKGALGRRPTYQEFMADRSALQANPNLDAEKVIYALEFVQRSEFTGRYAAATTAGAFVDAVIQNVQGNSGIDLTPRRNELLAAYNAGSGQTDSRALTLRALVDHADFQAGEYNRGFVLAQYFSYLRREPDMTGYNFWLNVLNHNPSDFRVMVCNFITAGEYQDRFGSQRTHSNAECSDPFLAGP